MLPDRVRDVGRCKVRVVALCHADIGVAELARDDVERNTLHRQGAAVGVPQHVETDGGRYLSRLAGVP